MLNSSVHRPVDRKIEIHAEAIQRFAQFGLLLSVGTGWALLPAGTYPYQVLPVLALMAACNLLGLYFLRREKTAQAGMWVAGGNSLVLVLLILLFPYPWLPFAALPLMLMIAMTVSNLAGLSYAILVTGLLIVLNLTGFRNDSLVEVSFVLACGLVVHWISVNTLSTAADWYRIAQAQSDRLLAETRQHRAELSRANKSLQLSNELQRKTQNELIFSRKQAEKARQMKEQFAANISHELRTPLNLILGFSKLMYLSPEIYGGGEWSPELRHDIAQIYRSSRHLMEMIDDILDLSQFEMTGFSLVKEATPIYLFLKDAAETIGNLFHGGRVQFLVHLAEDLPVLDIDRTRMRQVLVNLLTNAYRYTQSGYVELSAWLKDDQVVISVRDTGPGIAPEKLAFVFDEFFQADASLSRKSGGVGLGLTICRRFVEAHNGRIWAESQVDQGSTFSFSLPCSGGAGYVPGEPASDVIYSGLLPNVILVETDPEVVNITRRQVANFEWIQAKNLEELGPVVKQFHPRAVVLNVASEKMNPSLEFPQLDIPILACSLPSRFMRDDSFTQFSLLRKPLEIEELAREMDRWNGVRDLLVIDDDRGFVQLTERLVQATGRSVDVRWAYSGQEGLSAMREKRPDMVLLDLVMQDMNGMEVLEKMQADPELKGIPVCLVTSGSYELESLSHLGRQITVYQAEGIRPSRTFAYLQALLNLIEPNHAGSEK